MEQFGRELRRLREGTGKTMKEIADLLDCSVVYVSDIERGKRNPPKPNTIATIVGHLGGNVAEFQDLARKSKGKIELDLNGSSPEIEQAGLVFARSWKDMSADQARQIIELLNPTG